MDRHPRLRHRVDRDPARNGTYGSDLADRPRDLGLMAGLALVGIGALIAADQVLPSGFHAHRFLAPVLLIGGGIAILVLRRPQDEDDEPTFPSTDEASVEGENGPSDDAPGSAGRGRAGDGVDAVAGAAAGQAAKAAARSAHATASVPDADRAELLDDRRRCHEPARRNRHDHAQPHRRVRHRNRVRGTRAVAFDVDRPRRGLIFIGLLLALATAASSAVNVPISGGIGEDRYHPVAVSEIPDQYELGIGHLLIDARDLRLGNREVDVNAQLGIGQLEILVPIED